MYSPIPLLLSLMRLLSRIGYFVDTRNPCFVPPTLRAVRSRTIKAKRSGRSKLGNEHRCIELPRSCVSSSKLFIKPLVAINHVLNAKPVLHSFPAIIR